MALKRLEDFTIRAADAVLCPSQFLAGIAESHYRLAPASVEVIPYPLGDSPVLRRSETTWRDGTICYVGRLEPRKGVRSGPMPPRRWPPQERAARFIFIGGDTSLRAPAAVRCAMRCRRAFRRPCKSGLFSGCDTPPRSSRHLEQARFAVVPSRWENFPYACMEAMASGLPVLVSPTGGMAEMVEDGRTGWIAAGHDERASRPRSGARWPRHHESWPRWEPPQRHRSGCLVAPKRSSAGRWISGGAWSAAGAGTSQRSQELATTDTDALEDGTGPAPPLVVVYPELSICERRQDCAPAARQPCPGRTARDYVPKSVRDGAPRPSRTDPPSTSARVGADPLLVDGLVLAVGLRRGEHRVEHLLQCVVALLHPDAVRKARLVLLDFIAILSVFSPSSFLNTGVSLRAPS